MSSKARQPNPVELIKSNGNIHASIINGNAPLYQIRSSSFQLMVEATPKEEHAFVFSFFAACPGSKERFKLQLTTKYAKQTYLFTADKEWKRHEFPIENDISLSPIAISISLDNPIRASVDLGILFPQLEKGKIASSPIGDSILLPIISKEKGATGASRAADHLSLKHTSNSFSSTSVVVFRPVAEVSQLTRSDKTVFWRMKDTGKDFDLTFYISGEDGGRFCVRISNQTDCSTIQSRQILGRQEYAFAITFEDGSAVCYIDGYAVLHFEVPADLEFDLIALSGESESGPGLTVKQILIYEVPLRFAHLVAVLARTSPDIMSAAYELLSRNMRYAISGDSEEISFQTATAREGFDATIRGLRFSLPQVLKQYRPGSVFTEEGIGDWVFALMSNPRTVLNRESYSKIGRSDLVLTYSEGEDERTDYHVEFKIWGRPGYKKLPSQPLKYLSPNDTFSVIVLVDRRKAPSQADFESIIKGSAEYPCTGIFSIPMLEQGLNYFVSFHKDINSSLLRMILNVHLCIPS